MKHEDWHLLVSAYCDDEVTPEERAQVEAHLAVCTECARALEVYRRLGKAVQALPRGTPSRTLWFRVQEELSHPVRPFWWRLLPVASAAAVLLVAVVIGLLLWPAPSGPAAPQSLGMERVGAPTGVTLPIPPSSPPLTIGTYIAPARFPCPGSPLALEVVAVSIHSEAELPSPRLRGLLYDESGRSLPSVTLVVSGTAGWQGTVTTAPDGTFTLSLPMAGTYRLVLALAPETKAVGAFREETEQPYSLTLPDGSICQTGQVEVLPALVVGPQEEVSLTLRVRP